MSVELDVFKMIDVVADKPQNSPPLSKEIEGLIEVRKNIVYDEEDPEFCSFDIYRIPGKEKYPVLFYIHGGGFVAGDKSYRRGVSKWYAAKGICVFNVNYGLCPKYRYPEPLAHLVKAMNKAGEMTNELNLDIDKFFVSGDSAGAYYASMLIAACNYKRVQQKLGVAPSIKIRAAVLDCGLYDIAKTVSDRMMLDLNGRVFRSFTGMENNDFEAYAHKELCKPIKYVNRDYPPVFIVYSKKDVLCGGQAERFIDALEKHGVYYESYSSDIFISNHCFPLMWKGKDAETANAMTSSFVERFIAGKLPRHAKKVIPKEGEATAADDDAITENLAEKDKAEKPIKKLLVTKMRERIAEKKKSSAKKPAEKPTGIKEAPAE